MRTRVCNCCEGETFEAGFNGRLSATNCLPKCSTCGSLERHRAIRVIYDVLRPELGAMTALHFAPDQSVDESMFRYYRGSTYGDDSSLDMMNIDLPDNSFDWVISNHVLEHVRDDVLGILQCLRVAGDGVVHVNAPLANLRAKTDDWGFADPDKTFHFRHYGADLGVSICDKVGCGGFAAVCRDPVTEAMDVVFFFSKNDGSRLKIMEMLQAANIICITVSS